MIKNKKFTCYIVEDEQDSRDIIKIYIDRHFPELQVIGESDRIDKAIEELPNLEPDLILLDIQLPNGSCFDILDAFPELQSRVIFITAHDEYALKAINYKAIAYLLKPFSQEEFVQSIRSSLDYALREIQLQSKLILKLSINARNEAVLSVPTNDGIRFVSVNEITHLEACDNYSYFHNVDGSKSIVAKNLKEWEFILTPPFFYRIHNSYILNLLHLESYQKGRGGTVILKNGTQLSVAENRRAAFLQLLNNTGL